VTLGEDIRRVKQRAGPLLPFIALHSLNFVSTAQAYGRCWCELPELRICFLACSLVAASTSDQLLLLLSCPIILSTENAPAPRMATASPIAIVSKWYS
jgi:hypothetical protein